MHHSNLPTKAELKKKYGITNDDFKILTIKPTDEELKRDGGTIEEVVSDLGFPTYLIRAGARVMAVLLLPALIINHKEDLTKSLEFWGSVAKPLEKLPNQPYTPVFRPDLYANTSNVVTVTVSNYTPRSGNV